jgi:pimeloyl-ACP methyl ester carboxylesterase
MAAEQGGMAAVANTPFFAARIAANPDNRDRLMALAPEEFITTFKRWNTQQDCAVAGATDDELRTITCPTLIFEGGDDIHPQSVSAAMARLIPNAKLVPSPWSAQSWMDRFTGRVQGSVFELYPLLTRAIIEFIKADDLPVRSPRRRGKESI